MAYKFQIGTTQLDGATTYADALTTQAALSGATSVTGQTISADGAVTGGSLTDGTATITGGAASGLTTVVMGGALSGVTTGTFSSTVSGAAGRFTSIDADGGKIGSSGTGTLSGSGACQFGSVSLDGGDISSNGSGQLSTKTLVMSGALSGVTTAGASGLASLDGGINTNDDFTVDTDGNVVGVAGTLSGLASLDGGINTNDDFTVDTDGNIVGVAGTLSGLASLDGGINVNDDFTVDTDGGVVAVGVNAGGALSGVTTIAASGVSSLDGGINVNDDFTVSIHGAVVAVGIAAGGAVSGVTNLTGSGTLSGFTTGTFSSTVSGAAAQFTSLDSDGGKIQSSGDGTLSGSGAFQAGSISLDGGKIVSDGTGDLDLKVSYAASTAVATADKVMFFDANASSKIRSYTWSSMVDGIAGTGLSGGGDGTISLSSVSTPHPIGNANSTLVEGLNFATASINAARTYALLSASAFDTGDLVKVKMAGGVTSTNTATISCSSGADTIDGATTIELESTYAAVTLVKAKAATWVVL